MPQVFISYAHANPDQELAAQLAAFLDANGFAVFVDSKIQLGQDWVEQIDTQLRRSDYFVVLLSPVAVKSDMVRREIAIAYKLRKANKLTIFPIRIDFEGELPYDIGAYLDLIQYIVWRPGQPHEPVCQKILEALGAPSSERPKRPQAPAPAGVAAQAPALNSHAFDKSELDRVGRELARYLGPVARVILERAVRKAANWEQLYQLLALEIPTGEERKKFLAASNRRTA